MNERSTPARPRPEDSVATAAPASRPAEEPGGAVLGRVRLVRRIVRLEPLVVVERYRGTPSSVSMNV